MDDTPSKIATQAEFLRAGGYTKRYHGRRILMEDTVGHHSYNVANLVSLFRPDCRKELVLAALRHDSAEWVVGDVPAPTKRRVPGLQEAFGEYEAEAMAEAGLENFEKGLTKEEAYILKVADSMDGMMFCLQELSMGNRLMIPIFVAYDGYVTKMIVGKPFAGEHALYNHIVAEWHTLGGPHYGHGQ